MKTNLLVDVSGAGVRHGDGLPEQLDLAVSSSSGRRPVLPHLSVRSGYQPPSCNSETVVLLPGSAWFLDFLGPDHQSLLCYAVCIAMLADNRQRSGLKIFCLRLARVAGSGWEWG
jgi:hypothetical protein